MSFVSNTYYLQNYIYLSKVCTLITVMIKIVRNGTTLLCWSETMIEIIFKNESYYTTNNSKTYILATNCHSHSL